MTFETLGLHEVLLKSLTDSGYENPTEVQAQTIPPALEGQDLRVCSNTGSGKTAAFVLPALQRVLAARQDPTKRRPKGAVSGPRILVLAPTRELALQVSKAASTYGNHVTGLKVATVVGGVPYGAQLQALRGQLDMLIATPGRLIDHLESGKANLSQVEMLILDEADRMLDMGFIEDIERIAAALPESRQTVMVSATFAGQVGRLADQILRDDALRIEITSHTDTHDNIEQQLLWADSLDHKAALLERLLTERDMQQAVVFTSTQRDADELAAHLYDLGHAVAPLHGGMPQGRRTRTLMALRRGELRILVATDVAARGIDVPTISHVINFGLPMKAEDYVHRIGRTGRAGRSGKAVTLAERRDVSMIRRIQQFTTQAIPVTVLEGLEPERPAPDMSMRSGPRRDMGHPGRRAAPGGRGGPRGYEGDRRDSRGDAPAGFRPEGHRGPRPGHQPGGFGAPSRPAFGDRPRSAHPSAGGRPRPERAR
ncbi:superfamily II DNA/RNA helicase [Sphaerotilus hippei]|uniref:Superfamily II DNA/RNA helicase n=1 Tax=Sphaerotilus hippei TaxID=744406 RepID=A0A318H657_9BURK|nr:DEAD/DEAH box helicase [Sphaerotilus hippei]PXW97928.1 superfamily II DNA/RNA helicase [Sphaerotilus hippei]